MESIESSYQGFVMTGKESYLQSYRASISSAGQDVAAVRNLTVDNPEQQRRLPALAGKVAEEIQFAERVTRLRRGQGFAAAGQLLDQDEGLRLMNEIRELTEGMEAEERGLLEVRTASRQASARKVDLVIPLGSLLALAFLIAASRIIYDEIAERTRAEEALGRLAAIVESSDDAIFSKSLDGVILSWNQGAERLFGYSAAEAVGQSAAILALPGGKNEGRDIISKIVAGERVEHYETQRRRKDGERIDVSLTVSPVKDSTGKVVGFSSIARDITERKRATAVIDLNSVLEQRVRERTAELEASNQELEAFTYSVAHDLRAPLRHLDGFSKLLVEEHHAKLSSDALEYVATIRDSALHMGALIDDLLNFAQVGRKQLSMQVTGLNTLVDEVRGALNRENADRWIEWKVETLPFVECDPALMKQVFVNLLSNAVKFTRPRKPAVIEVGVTHQDAARPVYVRDNGVGFSMKYVSKLFGVFQRLHRSEDFEGTGVGLATVQRIIQKHGGRVWAQAELEKGATFYFTLGAADDPQPEKRADLGDNA
jgi:PAS domain S-box-containing protein